jgi:hypothetical protein
VGHLLDNGFDVETIEVEGEELQALKEQHGVNNELAACHTALIDGYVVEGHVPASDIFRLLEEKPEVIGLSVPGMPVGSPGMENPSGRKDPYQVLTFDNEGNTKVYASY